MPTSAREASLHRHSGGWLILCAGLILHWIVVFCFPAAPPLILTSAALTLVALLDSVHSRTIGRNRIAQQVSSMRAFFDHAVDLYWETDARGDLVAIGGRLADTLLPEPTTARRRHYLDLVDLVPDERARMDEALASIRAYSDIQASLHDPAGNRYHVSLSAAPQFHADGRVKGYIGIATNVTERVRNQSKLRYIAEHDILTGLANRFSYTHRIATDLRQRPEKECVAVLAIDLDGFKAVNDKYGHQAGDALLKLAAKRLMNHIRDNDWAARLGGDEFVIVSRGLANPMAACLMASRLVATLDRPYKIGGLKLRASASIGIACAPQNARSPEQLMRCADEALYQAKRDGRACYRLYQDPPAIDDVA